MKNKDKISNYIISLAWPATYCRQAGAWYDFLMSATGVCKNRYYRAGHAALVLINQAKKSMLYFDFGRYHAPFGYGRVRSALTDPELKLKTIPKFKNNELINFDEILTELQSSEVFHGDGNLLASIAKVNYKKALSKAHELQRKSPLLYGPFVHKGSNCSRFVYSVLKAGLINNFLKLKLILIKPFTPTPVLNVRALKNFTVKEKPYIFKPVKPKKLSKELLKKTVLAPPLHPEIPKESLWLSGEGAGSWFFFKNMKENTEVSRYSPSGMLEFRAVFFNKDFNPKKEFQLAYLSHYEHITVIQLGNEIVLSRIDNDEKESLKHSILKSLFTANI